MEFKLYKMLLLVFLFVYSCKSNVIHSELLELNTGGFKHELQAFLFVLPDCPIAEAKVEDFKKLEKLYGDKVDFYYIIVGEDADFDMNLYAVSHMLKIENIMMDEQGGFSDMLRVDVAPTAVLLNKEKLLYRGLVDDEYYEIGKKRQSDKTPILKNKIEETISKGSISYSETQPIGCVFKNLK